MQYIKAKVAANMWKVDIMMGMYPMKSNMYKIAGYRDRIVQLYRKIKKVQYVQIQPRQVRSCLFQNSHFIDLIYDYINRSYDFRKRKQTIIFKFNNKLKMDIDEDYKMNIIEIKLPVQDEDF